jgi:hypothetical protein
MCEKLLFLLELLQILAFHKQLVVSIFFVRVTLTTDETPVTPMFDCGFCGPTASPDLSAHG